MAQKQLWQGMYHYRHQRFNKVLFMSSPAEKLYTEKEIVGDKKSWTKGLLPVSRTTWRKGVKAGIYPPPIKISKRLKAWKSSAIERVMDGELGVGQ
jgi:prophage regulatory protein